MGLEEKEEEKCVGRERCELYAREKQEAGQRTIRSISENYSALTLMSGVGVKGLLVLFCWARRAREDAVCRWGRGESGAGGRRAREQQ